MQFSQKAKMKIINIIEQKYIALIFLGGEKYFVTFVRRGTKCDLKIKGLRAL